MLPWMQRALRLGGFAGGGGGAGGAVVVGVGGADGGAALGLGAVTGVCLGCLGETAGCWSGYVCVGRSRLFLSVCWLGGDGVCGWVV